MTVPLPRHAEVVAAVARGLGRPLDTYADAVAVADLLSVDGLTLPEVERRARLLAAEDPAATVARLLAEWERLGAGGDPERLPL